MDEKSLVTFEKRNGKWFFEDVLGNVGIVWGDVWDDVLGNVKNNVDGYISGNVGGYISGKSKKENE